MIRSGRMGLQRVLSIMPNIMEISFGSQMERSVSISSDRNIRDHFWRFFALIREFRKGTKSGRSHSHWLARVNRKMLFHFPQIFPLISDR